MVNDETHIEDIQRLKAELEEVRDERDHLQMEIDDHQWHNDGLAADVYYLEYQLDQAQKNSKSFNKVADEIWDTCEQKGFHEPVDQAILDRALRLILIVSEVAEALEAMRKGEEEKHHEEIADTIIRLLHYGACEGIDLDAEISAKMETNRGRPYKHNRRF